MSNGVDERWIEDAVERYRRIEATLDTFQSAAAGLEVTVSSPDGLVEVLVTGDGSVRDVRIAPEALAGGARELSRSVLAAVTAARDAADWARRKLYDETFSEYPVATDD